MASELHRIFRKQLPIFMVSFPESSKYLPVPFVYSSLYDMKKVREVISSALQDGRSQETESEHSRRLHLKTHLTRAIQLL